MPKVVAGFTSYSTRQNILEYVSGRQNSLYKSVKCMQVCSVQQKEFGSASIV